MLLAAVAICGTLPANAVTVLLDAGHGGKDAGAIEGGVREADIVLAFTKVLEAELKQKGYGILATRSDGDFVPLKDRELYVSTTRPDVIISFHLAASKDPTERGIRILEGPAKGQEGLIYEQRELAGHLAKSLSSKDSKTPVNLGHLGAPLLGEQKAILIELAHLSNPEDCKLIQDPAYQKQLAQTLAGAINDLY